MTGEAPQMPPCAWCGEPSVTEVVTVSGRKNRRTSPVCESHAKDFEERGHKTTRVEADDRMERERKRAAWMKQQQPWMDR